jgi:hypothetical protein
MKQYSQHIDESHVFLKNHDDLLSSLILSKQNARNNPSIDENSQRISNGTQQPGQGISEHGSEQST